MLLRHLIILPIPRNPRAKRFKVEFATFSMEKAAERFFRSWGEAESFVKRLQAGV